MSKVRVIEQTSFGTDEEIFRGKKVTPQDFILKLIDLYTYEKALGERKPKIKNELSRFQNNTPRYVRFLRLYSILKAYGLLTDLSLLRPLNSFINGEFINEQYKVDPSLDDKLRECWETLEPEPILEYCNFPFGKLKSFHHKNFFQAVMHFRLGVTRSDDFFWSYLCMGGGVSQAALLTRQLKDLFLDPVIHILDETLLAFLSHERVKPYYIGELIDKYGYPSITDKQLDDIDANHF